MKRCPICAERFPDEGPRICPTHQLPLVEQRLTSSTLKGRLSGHVLDQRYLLSAQVGRGGMGDVYAAENLRIGRLVAVKVLHPELHLDPKMRQRLFREVQATSRISHPNVVEILDYGDDRMAGSYLVMEFLEGSSLGAVIKRHGRLPIDLALKISLQLALGLSATHSKGLIHRDLKPSNVRLLPGGCIKVLDFGLVKPFEPSDDPKYVTITTGGIAFGTPWYMSPEQASLRPLDPRTDIYSLGVVLYEMVAGQPPFSGNNPVEVMDAQRHKPVPLPRHLDPPLAIPTSVEFLLLRMLNKDPQRRPQSMAQLVDELQGVADELGIDLSDRCVQVETVAEGDQAGRVAVESRVERLKRHPTEELDPRFPRLVRQRTDEMSERVVSELEAVFPRYRTLEGDRKHSAAKTMIRAALRMIEAGTQSELPDELLELVDRRMGQHFPAGDLLGAVLCGTSLFRPLMLESVEGDVPRYVELQEQIDRRMLPFMMRLIDRYVSQFNVRLIRLNEQLAQRNEALEQLRQELADQLRSTSRQLGVLERLKSHLADSVSSGLILVERTTRRVLLCNAAIEQMFGIPAGELVDRSMDDVLRMITGVPLDEFVEQIQLHGRVGLRKLRVRLKSGKDRVVYVRGEMLADMGDGVAATLFIVDDMTERERVVEAFSRYVSPNVVHRVLGGQSTVAPSSQRRRAALLACDVRNMDKLVDGLEEKELSDLLGAYVSIVADVVSTHGGAVDWGVGGPLVAYFAMQEDSCGAAINATSALLERLDQLNATRTEQGGVPLSFSAGLHLGEVVVLNVGDSKRMMQTVIGEAVGVCRVLQATAGRGEILISDAVRDQVPALPVENGPVVQIDRHLRPVTTFRVTASK